jgi:hypothetical protein
MCLIDKTKKKMSVGIIVRYRDGKVMAAMCSSKPYITDLTGAEVFEAWKAVDFEIDLGIQNLIIEVNVLKILKALQNDEQSWSQYSNLIDDSKTSLKRPPFIVCTSCQNESKYEN